jgi:subtilisin family serine protease
VSGPAPPRAYTLDARSGGTGAGVRVAIVDSGVHAGHPHVQGVSAGIGVDAQGGRHDDYVDRLGHGTAVAAVVREKAPAAALFIAKVFDRQLTASVPALVAGIGWAIEQRAHLINLSLGTQNAAHEGVLQAAVVAARRAGALVVCAAAQDGVRWLPGALEGVVAVTLDWSLDRGTCAVDDVGPPRMRVRATGLPRPVPGVPPEKNLRGVSFAVANVTGLLAAAGFHAASRADTLLRDVR